MTAQDTDNQAGGAEPDVTTITEATEAPKPDPVESASAESSGAETQSTSPTPTSSPVISTSDPEKAAIDHHFLHHLEDFVIEKFEELKLDFKKGDAAVRADVQKLLAEIAVKHNETQV